MFTERTGARGNGVVKLRSTAKGVNREICGKGRETSPHCVPKRVCRGSTGSEAPCACVRVLPCWRQRGSVHEHRVLQRSPLGWTWRHSPMKIGAC